MEFYLSLSLISFVGSLIYSLRIQKGLFRNELRFWLWYFVIGFFAGVYARDVERLSYSNDDGSVSEDINLLGMIEKIFSSYFPPYLKAFAVMSTIRFISLIIYVQIQKRVANQSTS